MFPRTSPPQNNERLFPLSAIHSWLVLAAVLVTSAGTCQTRASTYSISGLVELGSGPPLTLYPVDSFSGTSSLSVGNSATWLDFNPGPPLNTRGANVYAYAGDGLARLSMDSHYRDDAPPGTTEGAFHFARGSGTATVLINDLIITGPGTGSIATSLNLHLGGTLDASSTFSATRNGVTAQSVVIASLRVQGSAINDGFYRVISNNSNRVVEDFGWLTGFDGDAVLTSNSFNVQLGTPFTVEFTLEGLVQSTLVDITSGSAISYMRFDNTLSFNTEGNVFNLPPGFTANSVSAGIVNNRFVAVPEPAVTSLVLLSLSMLGCRKLRQRRPRPVHRRSDNSALLRSDSAVS
jgi:hypothetical protein